MDEVKPKPKVTRAQRYKMTVSEVDAMYKKNSAHTSVFMPRHLWEEWQRRKKEEGLGSQFSKLVGKALAFGLYGAHPYEDPIAGISEAFEYYSNDGRTERERLIFAIRGLCRNLGISPEEISEV